MTNQYLLKEKSISDIRIFGDRSVIQEVYKFPKNYLIIATRYADELKDRKFKMKGNNYFMISFTAQIPDGEIIFEKETKWDPDGKGKQEVQVGVDPLKFNSQAENEKSVYITKLIANILREYLKRYDAETDLIDEIENQIL